MISPRLPVDAPVYEALLRNPSFVPYYDDGNAVLFGRVDPTSADRDRFLALRLDAEQLVYHRNDPIGDPERTPSPVTWMDQILRHRALEEPGPHVTAAARWLGRVWSAGTAEQPLEPADCLMAIREARIALTRNPDDKFAFQLLQAAYENLTQAELTIIGQAATSTATASTDSTINLRASSAQGLSALDFFAPSAPPTNITDAFRRLENSFLTQMLQPTADTPATPATPSPTQFIFLRYRQRIAALNFAIQTTPPPRNVAARGDLASLHAQIADLYLSNQAFDLARDHLRSARELVGPTEFGEVRQQQLDQLNEEIDRFQTQFEEETANMQAGPIQRASLAVQQGFLGLAIEELRAAESAGVSLIQVRPMLVDLYCRVGQPDEAFTLLEQTTVNDPSLSSGPGTAAYRQGIVHLLLGYYTNATFYWQGYAIPELRRTEVFQALNAARSLIVGEPAGATSSILEITGTSDSRGFLDSQAQWEFELGLALLEAGQPQDVRDERGNVVQLGAASHFLKAIELDAELPTRPLIDYYLKKLGAEVPSAEAKTPPAPGESSGAELKPGATTPETTANPAASPSPRGDARPDDTPPADTENPR